MNSLFQGRETVVKEADRISSLKGQGKVTDIFKNNPRNSFIPKRRKSTANQKGHLKSHRQDICSVRTSERQTNQVKPTSVPNVLSLNLSPKSLRSTTKDFLPSSSRKRASAQTTDISRILDLDIDILTGKHYEKQRSVREEWSVRKRSKLLGSSGSQRAPYLQETTGTKSSKVTIEKIETMALPKNTKYTDTAQSSTRGPGSVDEAESPTGPENRARCALIANRRNTTHTCRSVDNCANKHWGPAVFSESNISAKRRDKQYAHSEVKSELRVHPYSRGRCKSSDSIRTNHAFDRGGDDVAMRYKTDVTNRDKLCKSSTLRESTPRGSTPRTVPRSVEEERYFNRNTSECTKKQIS